MLWISLKFGDTCLLGGDFVQDQASSIVCTGVVCVCIYIERERESIVYIMVPLGSVAPF